MTKHKPKKHLLRKIVVAIILILFFGPFLIPVGQATNTVDARGLAFADSKFVNIRGIDIHYRDIGSGEKVYILLHGFGASTYTWHKVESALATKGRVIEFDRPAFGLTDRPMSWGSFNPYTPESQVEITIGLMNKLGIEKATLIGHSAGAAVALNTAIKYPKRVSELVLVDPAVYQTSAPKWTLGLFQLAQIDRFGPTIARSIGANLDSLLRSFWYDPGKLTQADYDAYNKPFTINNWDRALWNLTKYTYSLSPEDNLSALTMPVVIINGENDPIVSVKDSQNLASKINGASLDIISSSGHLPHEEQPDKFLEVLTTRGI